MLKDGMMAVPLSELKKNKTYILHHFDWSFVQDVHEGEMKRRFIERGIIEGVEIEVIEWGLFGRDPIAISVNGGDFIVGVRKVDAAGIFVVEKEDGITC